MRNKNISLKTTIVALILVVMATTLVSAAVYFTFQVPSSAIIESDWAITVTPSALDFGSMAHYENVTRTTTVEYIGNNPNTTLTWGHNLSGGPILTSSLVNGTVIDRYTPTDFTFTFDSNDALAGSYSWTISINSGD